MALPTTRRARYVYRQKRYTKRRRRANVNRLRIERFILGVPVLRRAGDWTMQGDGRLQLPPGRHPERGSGPVLPLFSPFLHRHILAAHWRVPPVVQIHNPLHLPAFGFGTHTQQPIVGFAVRRAQYTGRKLFPKIRLTGYERAIWCADRFFESNGFYPAFDPLGRHPNELDP